MDHILYSQNSRYKNMRHFATGPNKHSQKGDAYRYFTGLLKNGLMVVIPDLSKDFIYAIESRRDNGSD